MTNLFLILKTYKRNALIIAKMYAIEISPFNNSSKVVLDNEKERVYGKVKYMTKFSMMIEENFYQEHLLNLNQFMFLERKKESE
jgi:hypothetical protein